MYTSTYIHIGTYNLTSPLAEPTIISSAVNETNFSGERVNKEQNRTDFLIPKSYTRISQDVESEDSKFKFLLYPAAHHVVYRILFSPHRVSRGRQQSLVAPATQL